jgi:hemolysin activation/secretion protein
MGEQVKVQAATSSASDRYQYLNGTLLRWFGRTQGFVDWQGTDAAPDPSVRFSDRNITLGFHRALVGGGGGSLALLGTVNGDDSIIHDATNTRLLDDRIRSFAVGLQYQLSGPTTQTSAYSSVNHAVSALGAASLDTADSRVSIDFTRYLLGLTHSFSFAGAWGARISADAQVTKDVLPVVEKFAFGGLGLGDAFDPATLVGDSGADLTAELAHAWRSHLLALQAASVFARADYGIVWNNADYLPRREEAASVSLGALARWPSVTGTVLLSTPVRQATHAPAADSVRALFSLAWTL